MTRLARSLLLGALALAALPFGSVPADAGVVVMCRAAAVATAAGPGRWTAPASGTSYTLDGQGCALIALADIGDAQAGGLTQSGPLRAIVYNTGVATGTTNHVVGVLPANAYIHNIIVFNSTANAVTGGIAFGTAASGTQIVTALACAANCLVPVADSALTLRVFSTTATTTVNAAAVTAWNSANVTITVLYSFF